MPGAQGTPPVALCPRPAGEARWSVELAGLETLPRVDGSERAKPNGSLQANPAPNLESSQLSEFPGPPHVKMCFT